MPSNSDPPPNQGPDPGQEPRYELPPQLRDTIRQLQAIRFSPQLTEALAAISKQAQTALTAWQRSVAATVAPALEQWSLQLPKVQAWVKAYGPTIAEFAARAHELWLRAMPPNWLDLSAAEVTEAIRRVRETGFSLVWVPRPEIVAEVLSADAADTGATVLARRDDVLEDVRACLAEVSDADLSLERDAANEAVDAFRAGHVRAAQALASSAFTSAVHVWFQIGRTRTIRKLMADEDPEDVGISELRLRTIYLAGTVALEQFRPDLARPVHKRFNRHNTAHRITKDQWTEANALSSIMLAASLIRELDYWFQLERATTETADAA